MFSFVVGCFSFMFRVYDQKTAFVAQCRAPNVPNVTDLTSLDYNVYGTSLPLFNHWLSYYEYEHSLIGPLFEF